MKLKTTTRSLFVLGLCLAWLGAAAQADNKACLDEIIQCENSLNIKDTTLEHKNIFMSYAVRVTNWDDEVVTSNVKMYRNYDNLHFFSEQANIYRDENEALMILPGQHLVVLSSTSKELNHLRYTDEFFEMREAMLKNCDVVSCTKVDDETRRVTLKVNSSSEKIKIKTMTYEYNLKLQKIKWVKTTYNSDYKLKEMMVVYKELDTNSSYKFQPIKTYFADKKGHLLPKYKDYELVDNRDQKSHSKSK